ncbi:MAG TPA: hypothetical protein VFD52_05405 [Clostridia bacterium]|nr:hypothetical protein [Clostridia bacterium]
MILSVMDNFKESLVYMGKGMSGIMFVIIIIALIVSLMTKFDSPDKNKNQNNQ